MPCGAPVSPPFDDPAVFLMTLPRFDFYHLTRSPLEDALPRLLLRVRASGARAVVMATTPDRVEHLNVLLWTFDPASWLPHGSLRDGAAADQPIWLTCEAETPNDASILVLVDGAWPPAWADTIARVLILFDGRDPEAVALARSRWRSQRDLGAALSYWQQDPGGGWREKASQPSSLDPDPGKRL